jgi:hypothetical protein
MVVALRTSAIAPIDEAHLVDTLARSGYALNPAYAQYGFGKIEF